MQNTIRKVLWAARFLEIVISNRTPSHRPDHPPPHKLTLQATDVIALCRTWGANKNEAHNVTVVRIASRFRWFRIADLIGIL